MLFISSYFRYIHETFSKYFQSTHIISLCRRRQIFIIIIAIHPDPKRNNHFKLFLLHTGNLYKLFSQHSLHHSFDTTWPFYVTDDRLDHLTTIIKLFHLQTEKLIKYIKSLFRRALNISFIIVGHIAFKLSNYLKLFPIYTEKL